MAKFSVEAATDEGDVDNAAERRRSHRAEFLVRIDYSTVDELFSEFSRDINAGGLFIETDKPSPTGTVVSMYFDLPGSEEPIQTLGRVVRISSGDSEDPPGMGIEFDELTPEARARIDALIRALRSGAPPRAAPGTGTGAGEPPA